MLRYRLLSLWLIFRIISFNLNMFNITMVITKDVPLVLYLINRGLSEYYNKHISECQVKTSHTSREPEHAPVFKGSCFWFVFSFQYWIDHCIIVCFLLLCCYSSGCLCLLVSTLLDWSLGFLPVLSSLPWYRLPCQGLSEHITMGTNVNVFFFNSTDIASHVRGGQWT